MRERCIRPQRLLRSIPDAIFIPRAAAPALKEMRQTNPQTAHVIEEVLGNFGRQLMDVKVHESSEYPGVSLLVSEVKATKTAAQVLGDLYPYATCDPDRGEIYVMHLGYNPPGFGNQGTALPSVAERGNILLQRIVHHLKNGKPVPDLKIVVLSLVTALGSSITDEFVNKLEQEGLAPLGRVYAEATLPYLRQTPERKVIFEGTSQGTATAVAAYNSLTEEERGNTDIRLFLNAPVANHAGSKERFKRALQLLAGYGLETAQSVLDGSLKDAVLDEAKFQRILRDVLKAKGIDQHMSPWDAALKSRADLAVAFHLAIGTDFQNGARQYHICPRQDALVYSKKDDEWAETKRQNGVHPIRFDSNLNSVIVFVGGRHNRWPGVRPDRWERTINSALNPL